MDILDDVLLKVKPADDENKRLDESIKNVIEKIKYHLNNIDADPILVGSVAKGTHLKNPDVDIFIRYSTHYTREFIEKNTLEIGSMVLENPVKRYAEHPYVHGYFNGFEFDIVPCYRIEDSKQKITAVDRTPFHTEYIKKNMNEEMKDQVRILKQFLKGIGIYGAEAKIEGFSGYLSELLILKFGTFMDLIKSASRWRAYKIITIEKINQKNLYEKFKNPLIVIDPVDPKRNVASALSLTNYSMFIHASREFLKNPSMKFFFPSEPKAGELDGRDTKILHIHLKKPDLVDDILYPQIRKFEKTLLNNLDEFQVMRYYYYVDSEIHIIIESTILDLPNVEIRTGPPVWSKNSEDFLKKWEKKALSGPYIKDGRFYALIPRERRSMEENILRIINSNSIGKDLDKIKKEIKIERGTENINKIELTKFLKSKFPWEY